jgi:hypothetical protein
MFRSAAMDAGHPPPGITARGRKRSDRWHGDQVSARSATNCSTLAERYDRMALHTKETVSAGILVCYAAFQT